MDDFKISQLDSHFNDLKWCISDAHIYILLYVKYTCESQNLWCALSPDSSDDIFDIWHHQPFKNAHFPLIPITNTSTILSKVCGLGPTHAL